MAYYGWGQELGERENAMHAGPYAGRGPKQYGRRDDFLYEDVCEALTRHPGVDASEIEVHVKEGKNSLLDKDGAALMIHAKPNDYRSQPSGDAGDRIACGVIGTPAS
jgi:hypothetical protein